MERQHATAPKAREGGVPDARKPGDRSATAAARPQGPPLHFHLAASGDASRAKGLSTMKRSLAGLAGLAALGAHAQVPGTITPLPPLLVTASRSAEPVPTLRDAVVITREELEAAGALSLGEILERRAGIELRATGGPGQPQGLFIRGTGTAQTLVLVDGLRVGSATVGTTSIENIPVDLIERIEVVKGPLSSMYGSDAIGGVVQVFTRGKHVPHLFASGAFGSDRDGRLAAGFTAAEGDTTLAVSAGARAVDARSATNPNAGFLHDPDRDPYRNAFANVRGTYRYWQGELVTLEAFGSRARTDFDTGLAPDGGSPGDRNDQTISGARITSASEWVKGWTNRFSLGTGLDRLETRGLYPSRFETQQDQASWIHELVLPGAKLMAGLEGVRQRVRSDTEFTQTSRETRSAFAGITQSQPGMAFEASARRDDDDSFGARNTGTASYGVDWLHVGRIAATYGRGFRAPTFFDLYAPSSPYYQPNPALRPEQSRSWEVSLRSEGTSAVQWKATAFDTRIEDLIVYVAPTVENVGRARIRGLEGSVEATAWGARWRAAATAQRPRDEATGLALPGRAERFATLEASRDWGAWRGGLVVHASGPRYDSPGEANRIGGYTTVDVRVRYAIAPRWSAELSATNLLDRQRETSIGYDAPRRSVLLSLRFEAF